MTGRTTNADLGERMASIEGQLKHTATSADVAKLEGHVLREIATLTQEVRNIQEALPIYTEAANRSDIQRGRQIERDAESRETKANVGMVTGFVAIVIAALTGWFGK